jgi:battenin
VPYYLRPFLIAIFWAVAGIVTWATPPNIEPPLRVLIVMLATATAAVTDVWMLGMLRYYGRPGVAGWGVGTGLGYVASALFPYIVTVKMGIFLRDTLEYLYFFIPAVVWGFYIILRTPSRYQPVKPHEEVLDTEDGVSLLIQEPPSPPKTFRAGIEQNINKMGPLVKPFMQPLYAALMAQAIFAPGFARASPMPESFDNFLSYATVCGVAFQLGNFIGRSSILFKRMEKRRQLSRALSICAVILVVNTLFVFFTASFVVFGLAVIGGILSGAVYIQTIDGALETTLKDAPNDCEFLMGAIGVADALGLLFGGLTAAVLETILCQDGWDYGDRWCYRR